MSEEKKIESTDGSKEISTKKPEVENEKICAILAYLLIGIIWFFMDEKMKESEFAKFHVRQALGLIIADFVVMALIALTVIGMLLYPLLNLACMVFAVIGIINASNGEKKELPFIGPYITKYLKF